jgi:transcriptional regulator with XRE-family HTH domain
MLLIGCVPIGYGARIWHAMPLPNIKVRFGRAIRRIREEQEINQEEAAERCGLHRTYYSGIERGVRNVSLVNVGKISRGLKTSLPELFRRV